MKILIKSWFRHFTPLRCYHPQLAYFRTLFKFMVVGDNTGDDKKTPHPPTGSWTDDDLTLTGMT
jgi:hypothetical protein